MITGLINRLLGFVLGAALVAAGGLTVIEGVAKGSGSGFVWIPGGSWLHAFRTTAWSDGAAIGISVGVGAVALLLVLFEVFPRRRPVVDLPADGVLHPRLQRRSTQSHLRRRLITTAQTGSVKVKFRPRRHRWRVKVTAKGSTIGRDRIKTAALDELGRLNAPTLTKLKVDAPTSPALPDQSQENRP